MKKVANAESLKAALDYFQMVPESTSGKCANGTIATH